MDNACSAGDIQTVEGSTHQNNEVTEANTSWKDTELPTLNAPLLSVTSIQQKADTEVTTIRTEY